MIVTSKLAAIVACCAIVSAPAFAATHRVGHMTHHKFFAREEARCPLHRNVYGELVSCDGWRLGSTAIGWDNSCLNLDYLPSQFACSGNGGS
jgi:hypothetical protein